MRYARPQQYGRSRLYSRWLEQQPRERQRELVAAERAYVAAVERASGTRVAAAKDFMAAFGGVAEVDPPTAT
jgi:hypothetical protein